MANNNNNKRKNWFSQQRERFGDNWLSRVSNDDIRNNCQRILSDMARGNLTLDNEKDICDLVADDRVISILKDYSGIKMSEFMEINKSLNIMTEVFSSQLVAALRNQGHCVSVELETAITNNLISYRTTNTDATVYRTQKILEIYADVYNSLEAFMVSKDMTFMIRLQQNLRNYRNFIDLNRAL